MIHRSRCIPRLLTLLLVGLLLMGATRWAHRAGYREGFAQAAAVAGGADGAAALPDAAIRSLPALGLGPLEALVCGLPLILLTGSLFLYMVIAAMSRHRGGAWAHGRAAGKPGNRDSLDGIGPEKQPNDFV